MNRKDDKVLTSVTADIKRRQYAATGLVEIADLVGQFCRTTKDTIESLVEITKELKRSNELNVVAIRMLQLQTDDLAEMKGMAPATEAIAAATMSMADALAALKSEMGKPRKAVFDENGEVIGSESVDTLQ